MATLRLFRLCSKEIADFPPACMYCGGKATQVVRQRFGRMFERGQRVVMPMCQTHRLLHLRISFLVSAGPFFLPVLCFVGIVGMFALAGDKNAKSIFYLISAIGGVTLLLVSYVVVACIYTHKQITAGRISDTELELIHVSPAFVSATKESGHSCSDAEFKKVSEPFEPRHRTGEEHLKRDDDALTAG